MKVASMFMDVFYFLCADHFPAKPIFPGLSEREKNGPILIFVWAVFMLPRICCGYFIEWIQRQIGL